LEATRNITTPDLQVLLVVAHEDDYPKGQDPLVVGELLPPVVVFRRGAQDLHRHGGIHDAVAGRILRVGLDLITDDQGVGSGSRRVTPPPGI